MCDQSLWGIIIFLIILLVGIASVSVHYRKEYEEQKAYMRMKGLYPL